MYKLFIRLNRSSALDPIANCESDPEDSGKLLNIIESEERPEKKEALVRNIVSTLLQDPSQLSMPIRDTQEDIQQNPDSKRARLYNPSIPGM